MCNKISNATSALHGAADVFGPLVSWWHLRGGIWRGCHGRGVRFHVHSLPNALVLSAALELLTAVLIILAVLALFLAAARWRLGPLAGLAALAAR